MATGQNSVELVDDDVVRSFARAALLAALLGAVAPIAIPLPFSPAPVTLQTLIVFLAGLVLGPVWGAVSMTLYLVAGAIGIPVFAGFASGPGILVGETAGFLWSYPLAAALVGLIVHRGTDLRDPADEPVWIVVGSLVLATLLIYAMGAGYGAWLFQLEPWEALTAYVFPFVPGGVVKIVAAVAIIQSERISPIGS
ncbi:biotin transporter BioY [Natrialbaceae archaeon A-arb3/5]